MTLTLPVVDDTITDEPRRLSHLHAHDPIPGCVAPCGYVWRNSPKGVTIQAPCPKCMNIDMGEKVIHPCPNR